MSKVELITWHDAGTDTDTDITWAEEKDLQDDDIVVTSVGFVVKETERYVTLAMDYIAHDKTSNGRSRIPKGMIVSRQTLGEPL